VIETRPAADCEFDVVALGEVMLRLDPGEGRIRTARRFEVWEGGGEYNVARGMRKVFGLRAGVVTALADNEIGHLVENLILQGGVDTSLIRWEEYDGIGRTVRNGLNFTERGFGVRGAVGVSDRANTAIAHVAPGTVDWDDLFGRRGVRWLHTGGIYAALSENAAAVAGEAMAAAQRHGTIVSFDLNYRLSLWAGIGGTEFARDVSTGLARHVDVMIGNEEDFTAALGFDVEHVDEHLRNLPMDSFAAMVGTVVEKMPWLSVVATTLRTVHSASDNDWQAIAWSPETGVLSSTPRDHLGIFDRVGGGDGFASGLVYGLLEGEELQQCLELGAAHGALAMTTPGDTSMATREEVRALASGGSARVRR
jgi:2-dehydro-3-deoxygluconokinase